MKDKSKGGGGLPPKELQRLVLTYLEERFGLESAHFDGFGLYLASKGRVYLGPKNLIGGPRIVTLGLLIARIGGAVKPSTNLLQLFGRKVTRNFIELTREEAISYAKGGDVALSDRHVTASTDGYILLRYQYLPLGCGLLKGKTVKNMLPKAKRLELRYL
jgi:NOL1/NOP2/fmu family ribosome biogenesis protein